MNWLACTYQKNENHENRSQHHIIYSFVLKFLPSDKQIKIASRIKLDQFQTVCVAVVLLLFLFLRFALFRI